MFLEIRKTWSNLDSRAKYGPGNLLRGLKNSRYMIKLEKRPARYKPASWAVDCKATWLGR